MTRLKCELVEEKSNTFYISGFPTADRQTNFPNSDAFGGFTILFFTDDRLKGHKVELHIADVNFNKVGNSEFLYLNGHLYVDNKFIPQNRTCIVHADLTEHPDSKEIYQTMRISLNRSFIESVVDHINQQEKAKSLVVDSDEEAEEIAVTSNLKAPQVTRRLKPAPTSVSPTYPTQARLTDSSTNIVSNDIGSQFSKLHITAKPNDEKKRSSALTLEEARKGKDADKVSAFITAGEAMFGKTPPPKRAAHRKTVVHQQSGEKNAAQEQRVMSGPSIV